MSTEQIPRVCPVCNGSGIDTDYDHPEPVHHICATCGGDGLPPPDRGTTTHTTHTTAGKIASGRIVNGRQQ